MMVEQGTDLQMSSLSPYFHQHELSLVLLILALKCIDGCKMECQVILICIFLMTKNVEHFKCFQPFGFHLLRTVYLYLYPNFKLGYFNDIWLVEFFIYFEYQPSIECGVDKNLFLLCGLLFCLNDDVLCNWETSQFLEVPFVNC